MEKIQIALDKAREQRRETAGQPPRLTTLRRHAPTEHAAEPDIKKVELADKVLRHFKSVTTLGNHIAVEAFRMLRTHVVNRMDTTGAQLLAVTSPNQGDGKTFVAVNLAITIAQQLDRGAILVDLDLRRPAISRFFAIKPEDDVSQILFGQKHLTDCLLRTNLDDLLVLPQRDKITRTSELLGSQQMQNLAAELRHSFPDRIVIFDCPPLLAADDTVVIQRFVDGVLLVAQEGKTTRSCLKRAADLLSADRFIGTVLNNAQWHELPDYY